MVRNVSSLYRSHEDFVEVHRTLTDAGDIEWQDEAPNSFSHTLALDRTSDSPADLSRESLADFLETAADHIGEADAVTLVTYGVRARDSAVILAIDLR